ncbi:NEAT domain-containing protein [Clostridium sp.]|uniref:NEAT domain-containing protein n=1 Tax=Clostridium sp. TaxID=1506 RepID=UPI002630E662|nr:NEAT domain-containing protein [Clostridium sp.]
MARKKINKILGYALVTSMLLGVGTDTVYAASNINDVNNAIVKNEGLREGIYEVNNITSYAEPGNKIGENMARNAIKEKTRLKVENGKTTMTIYLSDNLYGFMKDFEVSIGDKPLKITENKNDKSITFEVPSPDTKVKVGLFITVMGRKVELFLVNNMNTLKLIDEAPVINNAKDIVITEGENINLLSGITGTDKEDSNLNVEVIGDTSFIKNGKVVKTGVYQIKYRVKDSMGQFDEKTATVTVKKKVTLANGSYDLKNSVKYVGEGNADTGNSMARRVLAENSRIDINNGKNTVTLTFNKEMYKFLKNFEVKVDGSKINSELNEKNRTLKFDIPDLNSNINISMLVSMMGKVVSFNTILDYDTAKLIDKENNENNNTDGTNEENKSDGNNVTDGNNGSGTNNETDGNHETNGNSESDKNSGSNVNHSVIVNGDSLKNGIYNIENDVLYIGGGNQEIGNDMARKALAKESKIEVKGGKKIVTLKFNEEQFNFFKDFRITVNGKYAVVTPNEAKRTMTFEIPSLDSEIIVTSFVTVMGRDVSFKTMLKKDTLELVSEGAKSDIDKIDTVTSINNSGNKEEVSTSENNNVGSSTNKEEQVKKGKLYTIENKVKHQSKTGTDMARKYLNKVSDLEVVDGKNYLTLTFTGEKFMKNHKVTVNGKNANYRVVSKSGDSIKVRFEIPNLDADIKVSLHVVPMGKDVEFGVELLKNTKKFVKDFTVSSLPQTGGLVGGNSVALLGMALIGASAVIRKKED